MLPPLWMDLLLHIMKIFHKKIYVPSLRSTIRAFSVKGCGSSVLCSAQSIFIQLIQPLLSTSYLNVNYVAMAIYYMWLRQYGNLLVMDFLEQEHPSFESRTSGFETTLTFSHHTSLSIICLKDMPCHLEAIRFLFLSYLHLEQKHSLWLEL